MSDMERRIEEALMRRGNDVSTQQGAFGAVEQRIRRSQRVRVAAGSALAVAAIVAAVIVVPKMANNNQAGRIPFATTGGTPSANTSPSSLPPTTTLPAGWSYLRHQVDGYWLGLPDDWKTGVFEGHTSYRPPGVRTAEEGADSFTVEIFTDPGSTLKLQGQKSDAQFAGRPATRYDGENRIAYEVKEWPCYAGPESGDLDCVLPTLYVIIQATSSELWDQYRDEGEQMVSLLRAAGTKMPGGAFRTVHGRVADGIPIDQRLHDLITFNDARIFGDLDTAKAFLTKETLKRYESHAEGLDLYGTDLRKGLARYAITTRREADAASVEFDVLLTEFLRSGSGQDKETQAIETLGMVRSSSPRTSQIRFATRTEA